MELFTQTQKKIIQEILNGNTTLTTISHSLKISKPALSKHLKHLEERHIIKGTYQKTSQGRIITYNLKSFTLIYSYDQETNNLIYFTTTCPLDQNFPLLGMIKQQEFREEISTYLASLNPQNYESLLIILFGSVAQGNATRKSDIDLLILKENWTQQEIDQIYDTLSVVSTTTTHQAVPLIKTTQQFEYLHPSLRKEITNDGIILFKKGKTWNQIIKEFKRYRIIKPLD